MVDQVKPPNRESSASAVHLREQHLQQSGGGSRIFHPKRDLVDRARCREGLGEKQSFPNGEQPHRTRSRRLVNGPPPLSRCVALPVDGYPRRATKQFVKPSELA